MRIVLPSPIVNAYIVLLDKTELRIRPIQLQTEDCFEITCLVILN